MSRQSNNWSIKTPTYELHHHTKHIEKCTMYIPVEKEIKENKCAPSMEQVQNQSEENH